MLRLVKVLPTTMGWPIAMLSSLHNPSKFASIKSASLFMQAARCAPVKLFHGPPWNAALAAATAASTSAGPATCTSDVTTESSIGFLTVIVCPDLDLTY